MFSCPVIMEEILLISSGRDAIYSHFSTIGITRLYCVTNADCLTVLELYATAF